MAMHSSVQRESRARRKADKNSDSEEIEPEDKGEMDNFQDLQLGSNSPLVRLEDQLS
jgi:hypothetical protein